jgi:hypothetical protein
MYNLLLALNITMATNLSKTSHGMILSKLSTKLTSTYSSITKLITDCLLSQSDNMLAPESLPYSQREFLSKIISRFSILLATYSSTSVIWRVYIGKSKRILFEMQHVLKKSSNNKTNIEIEMCNLEMCNLEGKINQIEKCLTESNQTFCNLQEKINQMKNCLTELNQIFYDIECLINQENKIIDHTLRDQSELELDYHLDSNLQECMQNIFHSIKYQSNQNDMNQNDMNQNDMNQNDMNQNDMNQNDMNQTIHDCMEEYQKILVALDIFDKTRIDNEKKYTINLVLFDSKLQKSSRVGCIIL